MTITENEALLMTADVARIADVTPATVRWWESTGRLPATKTASGARLFSRADVERFVRKREAARVAG